MPQEKRKHSTRGSCVSLVSSDGDSPRARPQKRQRKERTVSYVSCQGLQGCERASTLSSGMARLLAWCKVVRCTSD